MTNLGYYVLDIITLNQTMYVIDGSNNILISRNMGESWEYINNGIYDNSLRSLHRYRDDYLYAGGRYLHRSNQNISGHTAGDLNLDGIINILDVIEMVSLIIENSVYNELADLNSDELINVVDVIQLVNIILSP